MLLLLIGLLGALGTLLRYGLSRFVGERVAGTFPWGTLVVNLSGAFVLGALAGLPRLPGEWRLALGTGLVGGYTTFSTLTWESLRLIEVGETLAGIANLALSAGLGLAVAALGALTARLLGG